MWDSAARRRSSANCTGQGGGEVIDGSVDLRGGAWGCSVFVVSDKTHHVVLAVLALSRVVGPISENNSNCQCALPPSFRGIPQGEVEGSRGLAAGEAAVPAAKLVL